MPLWTLNNPPNFKTPAGKDYVATERGWTDPDTGEVGVAISNLSTKAGGSNVMAALFDAESYEQGDTVTVVVRFNERVNVSVGATLVITSTGLGGNITATAAAQSNTHLVEFSATVPNAIATLSLAAQTISGTIVDAIGGAAAQSKALSAPAAAAAGTRVIPGAEITGAAFDEEEYDQGDPISVILTFDHPVSVLAGATLEVAWSGTGGDFLLTAGAETSQTEIEFSGTVPSEAGTLSLVTQDVTGTFTNLADPTISEDVAEAAGEIEVA